MCYYNCTNIFKEVYTMMKKFFVQAMTLATLCCTLFATTAQAGKTNLGPSTVKSGYSNYYFPSSNSDGFRITAGTSVKVHFALKTSETNVKYGLCISSTKNTKKSDTFKNKAQKANRDSVSSVTSTWTVKDTDRYKVFITNNTVGSISVKNDSYISY